MDQIAPAELVNISLLSFSFALMLVLVVGMARRQPLNKRRLLIAAMQMLFNAILGALVPRLLKAFGAQGPAFHATYWICVTGSYFFGVLTFLSITLYARNDGFEDNVGGILEDPVGMALWVLNSIGIVLIVTNPLTHAIFSITPENQYVVGPFRWLVELMVATEAVLIAAATLRMRRVEPNMTNKLVLCSILIVGGTAGSLFNHQVSLMFPSAALVLAMLGVGVQATLEERLTQAQMDAAESRVRLLSGQIHPHFVFNSLNAIKALIVEDPELAERTVQDFSDYLRSHLDTMSSTRLVPFGEEMDHVRHYVSLEMADPGCPMSVGYDLGVEDFLIPPLTVQPLVENAIRHGIRTRAEGGSVSVSSRETEQAVVVEVADDGQGISSATEKQNERRRVGIENVRERIERQCNGTLEVVSGPKGTTATILLPKGESL